MSKILIATHDTQLDVILITEFKPLYTTPAEPAWVDKDRNIVQGETRATGIRFYKTVYNNEGNSTLIDLWINPKDVQVIMAAIYEAEKVRTGQMNPDIDLPF